MAATSFPECSAYVVVHLEDHPVVERENHTLHLLREIRGAIGAFETKMEGKIASLDSRVDRNHEELKQRIDAKPCWASVLGRYATAEFDERLSALEQRVSALRP